MSEENEEISEEIEYEDDEKGNEEKKNNQKDKNKEDQDQEDDQEEDESGEPIEVEVEDRGMNTDELPPEELQRLVDNNKELLEENDVSNMDHEVKQEVPLSKKELIEELNEKDKIFELLVKTNNQLKTKK